MAQATIVMQRPEIAGKGIADIVRFLLQRIEPDKRGESTKKLREKIMTLNPHEMSSKKSPSSASMGAAITFIKTILNGYPPEYVKTVLNYISMYLGM